MAQRKGLPDDMSTLPREYARCNFLVHLWKQRRDIGSEWGVAYAIYDENEDVVSMGWRGTEEQAEMAANSLVDSYVGDL